MLSDRKCELEADRLQIVVKGPAVAGGKVELDCVGRIGEDKTLSLL